MHVLEQWQAPCAGHEGLAVGSVGNAVQGTFFLSLQLGNGVQLRVRSLPEQQCQSVKVVDMAVDEDLNRHAVRYVIRYGLPPSLPPSGLRTGAGPARGGGHRTRYLRSIAVALSVRGSRSF